MIYLNLYHNNLKTLSSKIGESILLKGFYCDIIKKPNNKNIFNSIIGNEDEKRCFIVLNNGNVAAGCFIQRQKDIAALKKFPGFF